MSAKADALHLKQSLCSARRSGQSSSRSPSRLVSHCRVGFAAPRGQDDHSSPAACASPRTSTRQYARIVHRWVQAIGLNPAAYGTHTMRRTKAALIYRRTKNLRVVQLLLGHSKLESTVRYRGIDVDDALEIAEQTEV